MRQHIDFDLKELRGVMKETGLDIQDAVFTSEENTLTVTLEDGRTIVIQGNLHTKK